MISKVRLNEKNCTNILSIEKKKRKSESKRLIPLGEQNKHSPMYISNMTHFLDQQGNIPKQMPKEARELANLLALLVSSTTKTSPITLTSTEIRCFNKGCLGTINSALSRAKGEIHWYCPVCEIEDMISHWQGTKWNN